MEKVSVVQAAKELGTTPQSVREHMKRNLWPIGHCFSPAQTGKKSWEYHVYRPMLDKFIGKEVKENVCV